jgi:23S rRNA (guanosine2251-2'-O)-methyltransferase
MGRNSVYRLKKAPRHSAHAHVVLMETEEQLLDAVAAAGDEALVLVLDGIQDPHNLGACMRTAAGAGVTAVIAPRKGACGLTEASRAIACGGADEVPFLQVANLSSTIRRLKELDMRFIGTSDRSEDVLYRADLSGAIGVVLGSEGWGLRKQTGVLCDKLIQIPMLTDLDCLNVSVSAGVCLYEIVRQRHFSQ